MPYRRAWTEAEQRAAVVAEALDFVGTSYVHMGRIKGIRGPNGTMADKGGVDCAQLLYCVYHNVGLIDLPPLEHYSAQWMLNRTVERYLEKVMGYAREITEAEAKPADVVLYRVGRTFAHGGIIVDPGWPAIVHAYQQAGIVLVDHGARGGLTNRTRRFFTRW